MNRKQTIIYSLAILIGGFLITWLIFSTEPEASKSGASKETAMLVETVKVRKGSFQPVFNTTGNVQSAIGINLSPLVGGQIIKQSDAFIPGEIVKQGSMLLQIDPADFRNTLELREADLLQAEANYKMEQGRKKVAEQDFELLGDSMEVENTELVLREPQLKSAEANYKAAKASVKQAKLNLERATIKAPFNAQVLSRNVNLGSQVNPGDNLGRLVAIDEYWVMVNLPLRKLPYLKFEEQDQAGSEVMISDQKAWKDGVKRNGVLKKFIGSLEDRTRMARLIVSVEDPLALQFPDSIPKAPLVINSFVEVEIKAEQIDQVVRLDRDYLRKNNTVWVMDGDRLSIREAEILVMDEKYAYVSAGLEDGEKVITSSLATVAEGAKLREEGERK